MSRQLWTAIACAALSCSSALADMGRECLPRPLTEAEREASERVAERLRKSLPAAPEGWTVRDERSDATAGSCPAESSGKAIARPAPRQAQLRREAQQPDSAQVQIALQVGTKDYRFSGTAECKAAPQASIYGVPAALYSVSQRSGSGSLNLTLWQPKDGAAIMMSLRIAAGGKSYLVDTVKAGPKRDTKGSGRATLQKTGAGGVIAVDAVDASGEKITGKIECNRFGAIRAEGG